MTSEKIKLDRMNRANANPKNSELDNSIHSRENIESFASQLLEESLEKDEPWVTTCEQAVEQTKQISKAVKMTCPSVTDQPLYRRE